MSSLYTNDGGLTWQPTNDDNHLAAYQDCEPIAGYPEMFVMPGFWKHGWIGTGAGVAFSADGGVNFKHYDWGFGDYARYTSFATPNVGWISGGIWPGSSSDSNYVKRLSQRHGIVRDAQGNLRVEHVEAGAVGASASTDNYGYLGYVAKTTDGGLTWKMQVNETYLYFNGIHAVDQSNVWVCGEGVGGGYVWHTSDGGATWQEQLVVAGGSMITIKFFDKMEGWVGGEAGAPGIDGGLWHTIDGGASWHLSEIRGYSVNDLDLLDRDHVYATAFTAAGKSAVLEYLPV
eukprot:TRINITY_DN1179_c0_g1_i1.p1 TRINITY_DN1179_c0_g1~~TRINITY_DN1179_c0_g1_i1.p1  ORF type:complete len:288 (+),score=82.95 TRINITY_DN1179_c0_g1_i1:227-1090(+)